MEIEYQIPSFIKDKIPLEIELNQCVIIGNCSPKLTE